MLVFMVKQSDKSLKLHILPYHSQREREGESVEERVGGSPQLNSV